MSTQRKNPDQKPRVGEYRLSRTPEPDRDFQQEAVEYFERRRARLLIVATTRTSSGQTLDWIPRESQSLSASIATPPPLSPATIAGERQRATPAQFELEKHEGALGPEGTVPVLRKDLTNIHVH